MNKLLWIAAAALAASASGQVAGPASFEVASVKPAASTEWRESKTLDDRIDFPGVTLRACLAFAYRVKEYQVSGPPWIGQLRFDVVAKGPQGTKRDQLPDMMRALLRDRFQLEAHVEKKEYSVFVLGVGKGGPKLKESAPAPAGAPAGAHYNMSSTRTGSGQIEARRADMTSLANTLTRFAGRPTVNQTGIEGRYDFELEFSPEDLKNISPPPPSNAPPGAAAELGVSIFTSLQRVGLKLEGAKLPLDTVVVDRAEKTPTEN